MKRILKFLQNKRVSLGYVFFGWVVFYILWGDARPLDFLQDRVNGLMLVALSISLSGQVLRIWAAGHILKFDALTITGPYRCVRNPLYVGNYLMGLGFILLLQSAIAAVFFTVVFLATTLPTVFDEERLLLERYGDAYRAYLKDTPRWLPDPRGLLRDKTVHRWSAEGFMRNREYRSVLAYSGVLLFFVLAGHFYGEIRQFGMILRRALIP